MPSVAQQFLTNTGKAFTKLSIWIALHEKWLLAAIVLYSIARCVENAGRRFWFDEILTFYISRLGDIGLIFRAVPADGNPPLYYLFALFCQKLMGQTEFATRMPSIVAFNLSLIGVYIFVRRRCHAIAALFALVAFATASIKEYAWDARPYALLLAFTVITMVSWQRATEMRLDRRLPLAGMVLGIAGAIATHHFGIFHVGIPLAIGEATRLIRRRRLDLPLYSAGALGTSMVVVTAPLVRQTNLILLSYVRDSAIFYRRPSLVDFKSYLSMVNPSLVVLFLLFFASILLSRRFLPAAANEPAQSEIPAHEIAAAFGLALLVPIIMAVAWTTTSYFQSRYAIGTSAGVAILLGFFVGHFDRPRYRCATAAVLCIALTVMSSVGENALRQIIAPSETSAAADYGRSVLETAPEDKPIVIGSVLSYVPVWWYSPPELRARLHYLADPSFAVSKPDPLGELTLVADQPFVPSKVDEYRAFLSTHGEFLLYCEIVGVPCVDRTAWLKERLLSEGYSLTLISRGKSDVLYLVRRP